MRNPYLGIVFKLNAGMGLAFKEQLGNIFLNRRYRFYTSLLLALAVFIVSKNRVSGAINYMLTWIAFAGSTLLFSWITILSSHPRKVKAIAREQDSSRTLIFLLIVGAAFISLFAIIFLLQNISTETKAELTYHIALSGMSVICSWFLIHTIFTLRYAHLYYSCRKEEENLKKVHRGGLDFPNEPEPDYLDFAYFSFVLGMTFQVSDVEISSRHIRRLALLHGLLSFVYNTVIVALSINIISNIIQK